MKYLSVRNWSKFQHYKDRSPPWIKLQTDTFQNYEFSRLQDASKLLAICIWTLASRTKDGTLPNDLEWIKRQSNLTSSTEENLNELISQGFVDDASNPLADCNQSARPETEREGETEQRQRHKNGFFKQKGNGHAKQTSGNEEARRIAEKYLNEATLVT